MLLPMQVYLLHVCTATSPSEFYGWQNTEMSRTGVQSDGSCGLARDECRLELAGRLSLHSGRRSRDTRGLRGNRSCTGPVDRDYINITQLQYVF